MDLFSFSLLFIILALVSVLWRYWLNGFLKTKKAYDLGSKQTEPPYRINPEAYVAYKNKFLDEQKDVFADSRLGIMSLPEIFPKMVPRKQIPKPTLIEREVTVQYRNSIYTKKSFPLEITIEPEDKGVKIREDGKITIIEKLSFEAFEKEPNVCVELKFTEGDFEINSKKQIQKLTKSKPTCYKFLVKPLKAEDCVLTIVFSLTDKIPIPEKTTEKVITDKTTTPEPGKTTMEHSEQTTIVPVQIIEKEIELKSIDLAISVKSLFGLSASQLDLVKRGTGFIISLILLGYGIVSGELKEIGAVIGAFVGLAPLLGIEVADTILSKKDEENEGEKEP